MLDRVIEKGIVITYEVNVSVAGLRVIEIDGRVMVMSLQTYTRMVEAPRLNGVAPLAAAQEYMRRIPTGAAPRVMG